MPVDIYQTLTQLNELFQCLVIDMLGYEATGSPADYSEAAYTDVRLSWPTEGAPSWEVDEDVVFLRVFEGDDFINRQRETKVTALTDTTLNEETTYTRVVELNLIFYGPNSFDRAQTIRDSFYYDEYHWQLAQSSIYMIPNIEAPRRVPEAFQGQWWERADLTLRFNEKIAKNRSINIIESAEFIVYNDDEEQADVTVTMTTTT